MKRKLPALLMCAVLCLQQTAFAAEDVLFEDAFAAQEQYAEETDTDDAGYTGDIEEIPADIPYEEADVFEDDAYADDALIVEDEIAAGDDAADEITAEDTFFPEEAEEEEDGEILLIEEETEAEDGNGEEVLEGGEFEMTVTVDPKALKAYTPVHTLYESRPQCIDTSEYFDMSRLCDSGMNGDRLTGIAAYIYDTLEGNYANGNADGCFVSFADTPQWRYPEEVKAYAGYSLYGSGGERHERTEQDHIMLEEDDRSVALLDTSDPDTDTYLYSVKNMVEIPAYIFLLDHPEMFRSYLFSCTLKFSYEPVDGDMTILAGLESVDIRYRPLVSGISSGQAWENVDAVCSALYAGADVNGDGHVEDVEYAMACYRHLLENYEYDHGSTAGDYDESLSGRSYSATAVPVFFDGYEKKLICSGYADAFTVMMRWAGIPCMTVGGYNHAFNHVKLNGGWYLTDANGGLFANTRGEQTQGWYTTPMDGLRYMPLSETGTGFEWSVTTQPTCTERGKTETYSADDFNDLRPALTRYIPSPGHDWEYSETTATCNDAGSRTRTCTRCGETETFEMASLGHDWVETVTNGKCGEPRRSTFVCSRCGEEWTREVTGGEHKWSLTEDTASCEHDGVKRYACGVCGETKEEASPATGHDYAETVVTQPSCTQAGLLRRTCSRCGNVEEETVPATGHVIRNIYIRRYASCTQGSLVRHVCVKCGAVTGDTESEPLGHDYAAKILMHPSCTETGTAVRVCRRCGEQDGEEYELPARGHFWTVWRDYPATCVTMAKTVYKCPVCAAMKTEYTGDVPSGHDWEYVVTKQPTCTETGIRTKVCRVCHEVSGVAETIPVTDHAWDGGTVTKQPTCTETGIRLLTCTACGQTRTVVIGKTSHRLEAVETVAPTCTAGGYTVYRCADCGTETTSDFTNKTGHTWMTETITAPTCTSDGRARRKCGVCGMDYDEIVLEKTGHSWTADNVKAPTCTEGGYTHYTCGNCGSGKTGGYTEALGHDFDESTTVTVAATCTAGGSTKKTCRRCGKVVTVNTASPTGHSYSLVKKVPQTCRESGYDLMKCSKCGDEYHANPVFVSGQGHKFNVAAYQAPTTEAGGYRRSVCEYCGETRMEYTNPLPMPSDPTTPAVVDPGPAPKPAAAAPSLSRSSATIAKGNKLSLSVKNAKGAVTWASSNKKVATVSSSGKVTAKKAGSCKITAKNGGKTLTCAVKVVNPSLSKKSASVKKNKTVKLSVKGAKGCAVVWKSSNAKIATVDSSGKVKGIRKGSCKIYATVCGKTLTCKIKVK